MAAPLLPAWSQSFLVGILLSLLPPASSLAPVTDEDAALLPEVPKSIRCFSRSFEDFTCFWDERGNATFRFYYHYSTEGARECMLVTQQLQDGGWRHICVFPSQDVRLFTELCLRVVDMANNCTVRTRKLNVEDMGLISLPANITAVGAGAAGQLWVHWEPPIPEYSSFFIYKVQICTTGSREPGCQEVLVSSTACVLALRPGQTYRIQVCTKPDGSSLNGTWGPWSPAVLAETPHSAEEFGLRCSTPDLQRVHCEWTPAPTDANGSHTLFYQPHESPGPPRAEAWQRCQGEAGTGPQGAHACTFWLGNASATTMMVKVTRDAQPARSYFGEPFHLDRAVLTAPPRILQANVSAGRLWLQWAVPLAELAQHMVYQVRYATDSSQDWKVLQIQHAADSEVLDLRAGSRYRLQVRAQPNGQQFGGYWSAWSEAVVVQAPSEAGWVVPSLAAVPLFFTGLLLALRCTFPSAYSSVKQKLWPPVPDLYRVLGGFLSDSSKQLQANALFYKPPEELVLSCLLEIMSEGSGAELPVEPAPLKVPGLGVRVSPAEEEEEEAAEAGSLGSLQQDYMVLRPGSPIGSHYGNEYLDGAGDTAPLGSFALLLPVSGLPQVGAAAQHPPHKRLGSLQAHGTPLDTEAEETWGLPGSGEQPMPATDIANQSYLLMSSWAQPRGP
ncbi:thrombopoietin receptor [Alligator sinensis]|uniref:Thrombopoietin receptor n=1 Tax=Alligator sinensis TaxID=38654 RepID=A0A1U7RMY7_ALLSI|nr:thrombopoietin receptor [Alligator sinensis]